jgi:hypothetical protein
MTNLLSVRRTNANFCEDNLRGTRAIVSRCRGWGNAANGEFDGSAFYHVARINWLRSAHF